MSDKPMITKNELNYIETLYLYANLHDFAPQKLTPDVIMHTAFTNINPEDHNPMSSFDDKTLCSYDKNIAHDYIYNYFMEITPNLESIGYSDGREWFKTPNYRIGIITDYDKALIANQPTVLIQYDQHYMFTLAHDLHDIHLPLGGSPKDYKFKRIDITKIAQTDIDYTKGYGYLSTYRTQSNFEGTIYLGNRKNGNVYRMYDKTKELKAKQNYKKIELLSSYFGSIDNLYTFELELHRKYLRDTLKIETLDQLPQVFDAYHSIVGKIRMYEDTDRNKELLKQNKRERINATTITEYKPFKKHYRGKHKPSFDYLTDRTQNSLNRYIASMGITDPKEIDQLTLRFANHFTKDIQDLTITYEPTETSLDYKAMTEKHTKMRDNIAHSTLENEAWETFRPIEPKHLAPIMLQDPNDLF